MQDAASELSDSKQRVVSGFRRLVSDAEALLRGSSDLAGETMDAARSRARQRGTDLFGRLRQRVEALRGTLAGAEETALDRYRSTADQALDYARAHPGRALLVVLATGIVIGVVLAQRR